MAKSKHVEKKDEVYKTPSHYGSHKSMIDEELTTMAPEGFVVCRDRQKPEDGKNDHGWYLTEKNRLDDGTADPNRYTTHRLLSDIAG